MKQKLIRFMQGRYGNDELNTCLLILSIVCMLLSPLWRMFSSLSTALIVYAFFRMFSRNIYKRRAENEKILPYFSFVKAKIKNKGAAKLFMCPRCKKTLRIPKGKGQVTINCPCGEKLKRKS